MSKFVTDIRSFKRKVNQITDIVYRESCRDISFEIAGQTPVSKGVLLGQWNAGVGSPGIYSFEGGPSAWKKFTGGYFKDFSIADSNKAKAMSDLTPRINSAADALTKYSNYYFTNDTPYAHIIEHSTGHMVTNARQNWTGIVNRVVKRISIG